MPGNIRITIARTPRPVALDPQTLHRRYREDTAAFRATHNWSINDGDLSISFTPMVYISNDLQRGTAEYQEAVNHERRHDQDYRGCVSRFERQLRRRLRGMNLDSNAAATIVSNGIDWLTYKFCQASVIYHRRLQRATVQICRNRSNWPD